MEEHGNDLAGLSGEIVSPRGPNPAAELRKRRSTRIVQAVPLLVTGVDALGRPFQERTSTLIINCHGCRYQSKHYVLKNMWVALEIPHPEAGHAPRTVRGRVSWIQRPRTVRQLFQVAIELEIPGNVWGIAFPPDDWFAFPDGAAEEIPIAEPAAEALPEPEGVSAAEAEPEQAASGPGTDNLHILAAPTGTEASLQLARQMTRLLTDAKKQIEATASQAASAAAAERTRESLQELQSRQAAAQEEISAEAARAIEKLRQESSEKALASQSAMAEAVQQNLPRLLTPILQDLTREISEALRREANAQKNTQEEHLRGLGDSLREARQSAEQSLEKLRATAGQAQASLGARAEAASGALEEAARKQQQGVAQEREALARTAGELRQQLEAAFSAAEARGQERLATSLYAAQTQIQEAAGQLLQDVKGRSSHTVEEQAAAVRAQLAEEAARDVALLSERSAALTEAAEGRLSLLRDSAEASARRLEESLAAASESAARMEQFSSRLDAVQQQAIGSLQAHVDELLGRQQSELHGRAEATLEDLSGRIRASIEESSREAARRFEEQVRTIVQPHISGAEEAVQRLAGGRSLFDAAVALQEERARKVTEESFAEALARFQGSFQTLRTELDESARSAVGQNLADLDEKASDLKHATIESLFKSTEWYEKKAQTQLQQLIEKGVEQAGLQLREKAGEVSSVFGTELDHYSRNFVEHTQTQMEEIVREAFERARGLFTEVADATCAAFTDEIQRNARQEIDGFSEALQKAVEDSRSQAESVRHELGQQMTAEQAAFLRQFQSKMSTAVATGVSEAQQQVQGGLQQVLASWRAMTQEHQEKLRAMYGQMGDDSVEQFRGRLENVSNSWLVATVASLDHQSRDVLSGVATAAEEKLRATCARVFANAGDTLRERLKEMAAGLAPPNSTKNNG